EGNAVVLGVGEIEDGQQHQLIADFIDAERPGDEPFHQLVEPKDDQRDCEAETVLVHERKVRKATVLPARAPGRTRQLPVGVANWIENALTSPPSIKSRL